MKIMYLLPVHFLKFPFGVKQTSWLVCVICSLGLWNTDNLRINQSVLDWCKASLLILSIYQWVFMWHFFLFYREMSHSHHGLQTLGNMIMKFLNHICTLVSRHFHSFTLLWSMQLECWISSIVAHLSELFVHVYVFLSLCSLELCLWVSLTTQPIQLQIWFLGIVSN